MTTLFPKKISTTPWQRGDLTINKPFLFEDASETRIVFIHDGAMWYTESPVALYYAMKTPVRLYPAIDCAITNDARWRLTTAQKYMYYTVGEPFIAFVDTANNLKVCRGKDSVPEILDTGVTVCAIERGWKHVSDWDKDAGIVVAYVRFGSLFVRTYIEQSQGKFGWSAAIKIDDGVADVSLERTVDFRMSFAVTYTNGTTALLLSERTWPGVSGASESIRANISNSISAPEFSISVMSDTYSTLAENMRADVTNNTDRKPGTIAADTSNKVLDDTYLAAHNEGSIIRLKFIGVYPALYDTAIRSNISIVDGRGITLPVGSLTHAYPYVDIQAMGFNNSKGDLTITVSADTKLHNDLDPLGKELKVVFTPIGRVPVIGAGPKPVEAHNDGGDYNDQTS